VTPVVLRPAIGAVVLALAIAGCGGSTTTKTVTKVATAPATPVSTSSTTIPATSSNTVPVTASSTTSTTTQAPSPIFFEGAAAGRVQHPSSLQLTADGTLAVSGVQWNSWGGPTATGTGNASYHGCNPNCASAPVHTAVVAIHLADPRLCAGRQYYSSVTLTMNSGKLLDESFLQRSWSPC
jgi:hypothetical protein